MIPERLFRLASLIPSGSTVVDVGTDHLLLPIHLVERGICERVIAVERASGPYQRGLSELRRRGMEGAIDLRRQNGLEGIMAGEADVIVIAGLGGITITTILSLGDPSFLRHLKLILLQPMSDTAFMRGWLVRNRYPITREDLVDDGGRIYEVVGVEPGATRSPYDALGGDYGLVSVLEGLPPTVWLEIGLCVYMKRHPLAEQFIRGKLGRYKGIRGELSRASCPPKGVISQLDEMICGLETALERLSRRQA